MTPPLVSIIVPAYNCQETLGRTLSSLVNQTYQNIEIICVNDGSTDTTGDVLAEAATNFSNLIVLETPNQGAYLAREAGIRRASGAYIGFCDSDDTMDRTMVERMVQQALSDNADLVVAAYWNISPSGSESIGMADLSTQSRAVDKNSGWLCSINTALWNKLYRRSVTEMRQLLPNPPRVMEDAIFLYSLFPHIKVVSFIQDPLYRYNIRIDDSMSKIELAELSDLATAWRLLRQNIQHTHPSYLDIVDLGCFFHLGFSSLLKISRSHPEDLTQAYTFVRDALRRDFPHTAHNKFMKKCYTKQNPELKRIRLAYLCFQKGLIKPAFSAYRAVDRWISLGNW